VATGLAIKIIDIESVAHFRAGQILVCQSIQPNMTHIVPLAQAIVEVRGGMLIHGAIIARELAIPCVSGVSKAVELINDGDFITVNGDLGIVTIGKSDFKF